MPKQSSNFVVLVYRMPAKPTAGRVAVWRQLKKVGAIYIQQSVCVFPENSALRRDLLPILKKIEESAGEFHLLPLRKLSPSEEQKLVEQFQDQTSKHYQEIIENCEVNFQKEIEFETFRKNFTYEEAEEIRTEFEKIVSWYERVRDRDWYGAPNQAEAAGWLSRCEKLVEEFEAQVFEVQQEVDSKRDGNKANVRGTRRRGRPQRQGRASVRVATADKPKQ